MKRFVSVIAVLSLVAVACAHATPPPAESAYVPPVDAGSAQAVNPVEAASPCGRACENLVKLHCQEGEVTPGGTRCYDVCVSAPKLIRTDCVAHATTVDALHSCNVRCESKKE